MTRKILNAMLGFAAGIAAIPLMIALAPFAFAYFLYIETDGEDEP